MRSSALFAVLLACSSAGAAGPDPRTVAAEVDALLDARYAELGVTPAPACSDEDFLRRVAFDLAGRPPKPDGIAKFAADPRSDKRAAVIDLYLEGDEWAANQARYWRDVIYSRATNQRARLAAGSFETWLAGRLAAGAGWDAVAAEMLTATGDIRENGATGLIYAHDGDPAELAGEVSRVFLGIQIQCANCHDHPYDSWKREDFHTLAAFFPRVRVRLVPTTPVTYEIVSFDAARAVAGRLFRDPELLFRMLDRNGDGTVTKAETVGTEIERNFGFIVGFGDKDKDGAISLEELKALPPPADRQNNRTEYYTPDLADPASPGDLTRPRFFLDGTGAQVGTGDLARRRVAAAAITENDWFARATVNRVWAELVGRGFYPLIDDLGPQRQAEVPEALDRLCAGFVESGHDLKWLLATVANTQAYQRSLGTSSMADVPFAASVPRRLRGDQIYAALEQVVGGAAPARPSFFGRSYGGRGDDSARRQVVALFGVDPSTPYDEVSGDVPQALFLMNAPAVQAKLRTDARSPLAAIVRDAGSDAEVADRLYRLYRLALARTPTPEEVDLCVAHVSASPSRLDAYEDLLWALVNSAEFVTRR